MWRELKTQNSELGLRWFGSDLGEDLVETVVKALPERRVEGRHPLAAEDGPEAVASGLESVTEFGRSHPAKADHQILLSAVKTHVLVQTAIGEFPPDAIDELRRSPVIHIERFHNRSILRRPNG